LIEKVAADHHVSQSLIDAAMEGRVRCWFQELLDGPPWARAEGANLDEYQIYCRVALTVRTLASAGRVVLVGRGGVYVIVDPGRRRRARPGSAGADERRARRPPDYGNVVGLADAHGTCLKMGKLDQCRLHSILSSVQARDPSTARATRWMRCSRLGQLR
jgi:hypothetical protein